MGKLTGYRFQEPQQGFFEGLRGEEQKQQKREAKEPRFFTRDGPDDLRGVPQAHEGELVEPPRANVPDFY